MATRFNENRSLADGFHEDFKSFLEEFSKTDLKYQRFLKIWNEKKGHLIYGGRMSVSELLEFTEEAINTSVGYFLSQGLDVPAATCGLFMIYSLVHTQHSGRKAYARVSLVKLPRLLAFRQWAQNERKLDVLYVLSSLLRDGVFKFVATERDYGLEKSFRKYVEGPMCLKANLFTSHSNTGELHETVALLDPISTTLREYHKAKCRLPGNNNGEPCRELSYVKLDFIKEITASLEETVGVESNLGKKEEIFRKLAPKGNIKKKTKGRRRKIGQGAPKPFLEDVGSLTDPFAELREARIDNLSDFLTSEPAETKTTFQESIVGLMNMPIIIQQIDESQVSPETGPHQKAMDSVNVSEDLVSQVVVDDEK